MGFAGMVSGMLTAAERTALSFTRSLGAPPDQDARSEWEMRQARYLLDWGYWDGTAYDDLVEWATYKSDHGLVEDIRLFESHVRRVVDFYRMHVYSGELAEDGLNLSGGVPNAIPLDPATPRALASSIGQLWQWWGWIDNAPLAVLYATVTGNCAVEIHDDVTARKVRTNILWPGYISDIDLSAAGDVQYIAKEYEVYDPDTPQPGGETYTYRREMDKTSFRTYKDGEPFDYDGYGATRRNPYGFVPAVFYRGIIAGPSWGEPMLHGSQVMLDLANSLYTSMYGNLRTLMDAPLFVSGRTREGAIAEQINATQAALDDEDPSLLYPPYSPNGVVGGTPYPVERHVPASMLRIAQVAENSQLLTPKIDVGQVRLLIRDMIEAMEAQFPEIKFWNEIRGMPAITKPGVESAMGDVLARLRAFSGQCDRQTKKLHQMGVAIGGMRYNDGSWQEFARQAGEPLTADHAKFAPYSLESYAAGKLNHQIMPRDIVKETEESRIGIALQLQDLGLPPKVTWKRAGFDDAQIDELLAEQPELIETPATGNNLNQLINDLSQPAAPVVPPVTE